MASVEQSVSTVDSAVEQVAFLSRRGFHRKVVDAHVKRLYPDIPSAYGLACLVIYNASISDDAEGTDDWPSAVLTDEAWRAVKSHFERKEGHGVSLVSQLHLYAYNICFSDDMPLPRYALLCRKTGWWTTNILPNRVPVMLLDILDDVGDINFHVNLLRAEGGGTGDYWFHGTSWAGLDRVLKDGVRAHRETSDTPQHIAHDFGDGFYLYSDAFSAANWAYIRCSTAALLVFSDARTADFDGDDLTDKTVWAKTVATGRSRGFIDGEMAWVHGPMAMRTSFGGWWPDRYGTTQLCLRDPRLCDLFTKSLLGVIVFKKKRVWNAVH